MSEKKKFLVQYWNSLEIHLVIRIFGEGLETLLESKKEKRKQVEDLIPDVRKKKVSGPIPEQSRNPPSDKNLWRRIRNASQVEKGKAKTG